MWRWVGGFQCIQGQLKYRRGCHFNVSRVSALGYAPPATAQKANTTVRIPHISTSAFLLYLIFIQINCTYWVITFCRGLQLCHFDGLPLFITSTVYDPQGDMLRDIQKLRVLHFPTRVCIQTYYNPHFIRQVCILEKATHLLYAILYMGPNRQFLYSIHYILIQLEIKKSYLYS